MNAAMIETNKEKVEASGRGPAEAISKEQEEKLWNGGLLGNDSPKKLLRTLFFLVGKFFGLRGGREQRDLEWVRDIKLTQTQSGEVLVYTNQYRKNFRGGLHQRNVGPKIVKAFSCESEPSRCIIETYKLYAKLRPLNGKCKAFYLQPLTKYTTEQWYSDTPVGHNSLTTMIKGLTEAAGLEGTFTNHSLKKTTGSRLKSLSEAQRRAHTGNRSDAQNIYEQLDDTDFHENSLALYGHTTQNSASKIRLSQKNEIVVSGPINKKMKIQANGETNEITITFD